MKYLRKFESVTDINIELIEDCFIELTDHREHKEPIDVKIEEKGGSYKIQITYGFYDQGYVPKVIETSVRRLKLKFKVGKKTTLRYGGKWHSVKVHGKDEYREVFDAGFKTIMTVKPKISSVVEKLSFNDMSYNDVSTHLLSEKDRGEITKIDSYITTDISDVLSKSNNIFDRTPNLFNSDKIGTNEETIVTELVLEHPWGDRGHPQFDYRGYMKAMLTDYFKRFYKRYDVNIFYLVADLDPHKNPFCNVYVLIQKKTNIN